METILNLVWLAVTIAIIWLWQFRWSASPRDTQRNLKIEVVALICFIALLFPVISLTDDLHPEIMLVDAVGGKRNSSLLIASALHSQASPASSRAHFDLGLPTDASVVVSSKNAETVPAIYIRNLPISSTASIYGRSPPTSL